MQSSELQRPELAPPSTGTAAADSVSAIPSWSKDSDSKSPTLLSGVEATALEIRLDVAPPEINIEFAPPSRQASFHADALSPPDRARSRNRIRAKSDNVYDNKSHAPERSIRDRSRAQSEAASPYSDYILGLADPSLLVQRPESNVKRSLKHPATFQCNLCPKRFTRAYNLRSHLRTHTDERPFVCSVCGKNFARQHDRKRHEGLHSGEKKFICKGLLRNGNNWGCGRRFARADALGRHLRSEAGRICIKPLLVEEAQEKGVSKTTSFDSGIPNALEYPFEELSTLSEGPDQLQTKEQEFEPLKSLIQSPFDMPSIGTLPSSTAANGHSPITYDLPAALIAQYPALASLQWDQLPPGLVDDFNDSGYSERSSFEASSGESFEENAMDATIKLQQIPTEQEALRSCNISNNLASREAERDHQALQGSTSTHVESQEAKTSSQDFKKPMVSFQTHADKFAQEQLEDSLCAIPDVYDERAEVVGRDQLPTHETQAVEELEGPTMKRRRYEMDSIEGYNEPQERVFDRQQQRLGISELVYEDPSDIVHTERGKRRRQSVSQSSSRGTTLSHTPTSTSDEEISPQVVVTPPADPLPYPDRGSLDDSGVHRTRTRNQITDEMQAKVVSAEEIDYGHYSTKDVRPPYSRSELVAQAILSSPQEMLTIDGIFRFLRDNYAYYRHAEEDPIFQKEWGDSFEVCYVPEGSDSTTARYKIKDSERDAFLGKMHINLLKVHLNKASKSGIAAPSHTTLEPLSQPVPSDSGYHSGLGTDTESVCSLGSVGSSLGLPQNFLQEFIAFFGDILIEKAGARAWAEYALAHHSSDDIERQLNTLLKRYTERLSTTSSITDSRGMARAAPGTVSRVGDTESVIQPCQQTIRDSQILEKATKLIRRYRPKIARYFRDNAMSEPITENSLTSRLQALSRQLSLTERLGLLDKTAHSRQDATETINDIPTADEVDELFADIEGVRDLLVSGEAFVHLASDLRCALYCGDEQVMSQVERTISYGLTNFSTSNTTHAVVFVGKWSLPSFITSQYEDIPRIGSVVTLSGSALYAQATTCLEYAKTVWPSSGSDFIAAMEVMFSNVEGNQRARSADYKGLQWSFSQEPDINPASSMRISAKGPIVMLIELAQQLAWIGSALTSSPYEEQLAYCRPILEYQPSAQDLTFRLSFEHQPLHPTENACWLPMFCGVSIAYGFPIPKRGEEMGLEIPLEMMVAMTGIQHAVEFEGGVVMKGFSTIFVPIKKTGDRVQWHLILSDDADTRLSYREGVGRCKSRLSTKELSLAELGKCRAIVGWCTSATSRLGSVTANYQNIDYSGAEDADTPLKFAGGTLGIQQIGVAQLDFTLGPKTGKSHFSRSGSFQRIISAACKTPVVLFDTSERRAWLVPASNVMLHIAQHRHWLEPFEYNGKQISLFAEGVDSSSAKEILLKNATIDLSDYEKYTFKDLILNIWSILEFLIEQNVIRERATPGASVKGTLRESISGFEFKAVVEERSPFRQKQVIIRKTCGGWPMLARDIDALVLFASGFEDLIRPRKDHTNFLCNLWRSVPKQKDYLATSINTINDLYDVAGSRLDRQYLTSTRLQWHRGNSVVFEACRSPGAYRCHCNRLQQIVPKSAIGSIVPPGPLVDDGAVIFGQSACMFRSVISKTVQRVQAKKGLYSQPNASLAPVSIQPPPDDDASDTSGDEPEDISGSDTTIDSFPSSITLFPSQDSTTPTLDDLNINPNTASCMTRKRLRSSNESSGIVGGAGQDTPSEMTPTRAKHQQYFEVDPSSLSDEDEKFAMRPVADSMSSGRGLRKVDASWHLRHDSGA